MTIKARVTRFITARSGRVQGHAVESKVKVAQRCGGSGVSRDGPSVERGGLDRRSGRRGQEVEALAGRRRVSAPRVRLKPRPPV
jgi:hypothetical protein